MKLRKFKVTAGIALISCLGALAAGSFALAQQNRAKQPQADIKVTYKVSMPGGMQSESTTMIKGVRERSEQHMGYGFDSISIKQCDLRREIQLSDKTRKYIVTPMESGDSGAGATTAPAPSSSGPSRRGGVITVVSASTDTGERKEMFGFTARHVKTSLKMESSADACNPSNMHMETDGWYIDLNFGLNCEVGARPPMMGRQGRPGCLDRYQTRHVGSGRTGLALIETTIGYDQSGNETFRMTKEVADLSRQPLDAALFDIPSGYAEARDSADLMGQPDMNAMMAGAMGRDGQPSKASQMNEQPGMAPAETKRPGTIRIGVVQINNKTNSAVSTESLRERLISGIAGSNLEAVPLNASSASEADAEAKAKQCDFVLYTDITSLKLSAAKKLGGMLGRATGVGSGGVDKTEAKVEFKLVSVGESSPRVQSSTAAKEEGDETSAGAAIDAEARAVSSAAKKRG